MMSALMSALLNMAGWDTPDWNALVLDVSPTRDGAAEEQTRAETRIDL